MVTLLRTLTLKSQLKFGTFYSCTINVMLKRGRHDYLVWVYYNMNMINFTTDILDRLKIKNRELIKKPGSNYSLGLKVKKRHRNNAMAEINHKRLLANTLKPLTKGQLAWKNQGHG